MAVYNVDNHIDLGYHETYYTVTGAESETTIRVTAKALHRLAETILEEVPEPESLEGASFVNARSKYSIDSKSFALNTGNGLWYNTDGDPFDEDELLEHYYIEEVVF